MTIKYCTLTSHSMNWFSTQSLLFQEEEGQDLVSRTQPSVYKEVGHWLLAHHKVGTYCNWNILKINIISSNRLVSVDINVVM